MMKVSIITTVIRQDNSVIRILEDDQSIPRLYQIKTTINQLDRNTPQVNVAVLDVEIKEQPIITKIPMSESDKVFFDISYRVFDKTGEAESSELKDEKIFGSPYSITNKINKGDKISIIGAMCTKIITIR